jgi:type VI protein secretion system component Hcp
VSNVESSSGGGGSAVQTTFGVVSIVRATDSLSPELFRYAVTGIHFQRVVIIVTPKDQAPYKITLREASISRFKPAASAGQSVAQEVVDFRYWEICVASGGAERCSQAL